MDSEGEEIEIDEDFALPEMNYLSVADALKVFLASFSHIVRLLI